MKKKLVGLLLCAALALCTAGCAIGKDADGTGDSRTREERNAKEEEEDEDPQEDPAAGNDPAEEIAAADSGIDEETAERLLGTWKFVSVSSVYEINGQTQQDFRMSEDLPAVTMEISIYRDGDVLYADYMSEEYDNTFVAYRLPLTLQEGPLYDGCDNTEWHVRVQHPEKEEVGISITLTDGNELLEYSRREYEFEDGKETYTTVKGFLKEGSEEYANAAEYRYTRTVEVSTVEELVAAIDDNTHIILNEGVYDLADLTDPADTAKVQFDPSGIGYEIPDVRINGAMHLKLEAKDGADVEICTDSPQHPVLAFTDCSYIYLQGITFGHHVEPGTCGGSVIKLNNVDNLHMSNCHLYGCGTYGIDGMDCYGLSFDHTEIYECTYGIVYFVNTYGAEFSDCSMHDNADMSMINLYNSGNIDFHDCEFRNNTVEQESGYSYFVFCSEDNYFVSFERCRFKDNTGGIFSNSDRVMTEDCEWDDIPVG